MRKRLGEMNLERVIDLKEKQPKGVNLERVSALGIVEKRILLLLLQHESLTFSDLTGPDATVGHQPGVAKALRTLEARGYTSAPPRRGRRRRPYKLTDRGFLAALVLPEVWKPEMEVQFFRRHIEKFPWFDCLDYLQSRDILSPIISMFRFVIENVDVVAGRSSTPDPEPYEYPEAFDNYPVTAEVTRTIFDDVTVRTFLLSDLKEIEKQSAYGRNITINILLDDPKLKQIVMNHLRYEMAKNVNEFKKLTWWTDYVNKYTQSRVPARC